MRYAYVSGQFVAHKHAVVAMEDRGYQFADGVYEVIPLYQNRLIDGGLHLDRLERSLKELSIPMPLSRRAMEIAVDELLRRNSRANGLVYMQVTRGVAPRNHIAKPGIQSVLTMSLNPAKYPTPHDLEHGVKVITARDERWKRCDIKSIALLPNTLARMQAQQAKAREAWLIGEDGTITEGSLSNAYLIKGGTIFTHPANEKILGGITRDIVIKLAKDNGLPLKEEPFHPNDITNADEAFISGASSFVLPVTQVDEITIGTGKAGPIAKQLMAAYIAHIQTQPMRKGC